MMLTDDENAVLLGLDFVDLYVGQSYADIRMSGGTDTPTFPLQGNLLNQALALRGFCIKEREKCGEDEFTLRILGYVFRVTTLHPYAEQLVFVLRRSNIRTHELTSLGFTKPVIDALLDKKASGLVLICGEMSSGKTSTAASLVSARLSSIGGYAVSIEDPIETGLGGAHGKGRCVQIRASLKCGGYKEPLIRAMRTGAEQILIGETREEDTAFEVAKASINGHFIITTVHAGSIGQAVERIVTMCSGKHPEIGAVLADGLSCIIYQELVSVGNKSQLRAKTLLLSDPKLGDAIRERIRTGKYGQLREFIEQQAQTYLHGNH